MVHMKCLASCIKNYHLKSAFGPMSVLEPLLLDINQYHTGLGDHAVLHVL